ncbi:MAG: SGNH/GDSL hydrolase family protein [Nakamurella sp.]
MTSVARTDLLGARLRIARVPTTPFVPSDFDHLSGRRPGPVMTAASLLLPGVRAVRRQVQPFADWWQESNARALDAVADGAKLWVALGDSMTLGSGASAPLGGFVGQILARHPGWVCVNLAIYGGRIADLRERALPALAALPTPDIVTLLIGSNDLMKPALRTAAADGLTHLLREVPEGTVVGNQPGTYGAAQALNAAIDAAVASGRVRLADLRDPRARAWGRSTLAADHFHPNDAGYRGIAEIFDEAMFA